MSDHVKNANVVDREAKSSANRASKLCLLIKTQELSQFLGNLAAMSVKGRYFGSRAGQMRRFKAV